MAIMNFNFAILILSLRDSDITIHVSVHGWLKFYAAASRISYPCEFQFELTNQCAHCRAQQLDVQLLLISVVTMSVPPESVPMDTGGLVRDAVRQLNARSLGSAAGDMGLGNREPNARHGNVIIYLYLR